MNPVEEFLQEGMEKEAISPAARSAIEMGLITAGTTALAAVGASQLQQGIQSATDAVSRSMAYKRMLNDNPDIRKMNGKRTRRYFDTMYRMAPEVAKDPFAAGSWVKGVHDMGMDYVNPQMLQTLAATGDKLRDRRKGGVVDPFQLAQSATQAGIGEYGRLESKPSKWDKARDWVETGIKGIDTAGKAHSYITDPNRKTP